MSELRERLQNYRDTFGDPSGEAVLKDLAEEARANDSCFVPGQTDGTAYLNGKRDLYLYIQRLLNTDPATIAPDNPEEEERA